MFDWLAGQFGEQTALIIYYLLIFVALITAFFILRRIWKSITGGTFIHGGKDQRRLAVVDATAVDNRRRLVLVRRDNVEHLVMIGGMSDVLIESNIGAKSASAGTQDNQMRVDPPAPARRKATPAATEPLPAEPAAVDPAPVEPVGAPAVAPAAEPARRAVPEASPAPRNMAHRPASAGAAGFAGPPSVSGAISRPTPPEPPVKEPAKTEPSFDVAQTSADIQTSKSDDFDFDLEISANDIRTDMEQTSYTPNHGAPSVDIARENDDTESRKPLEDEMEELLNNLTGANKRP